MRDQKVEFQTSREYGDLTLVGNYWDANSDTGIVMAHGFTGNKEQYGKFTNIAERLYEAGFSVLSFDFSGCGESDEDSITVEKEVEDIKSAIEFIKSKGVTRIGLLGLSQGGLISLKVSDPEVNSIFLMAPVTDSLPDYRSKLSEWQRQELEDYGVTRKYKPDQSRSQIVFSEEVIKHKENLNQDKVLEDVNVPVKIVHGTEDTSIPIEQSRKAVRKLEESELAEIEEDHYFEDSVEEIAAMAAKYFSNNLELKNSPQ